MVLPQSEQPPLLVDKGDPQALPVLVLEADLTAAGGVPGGDKAVAAVGDVGPVLSGALLPVAFVEGVVVWLPQNVRPGGGGQGQQGGQHDIPFCVLYDEGRAHADASFRFGNKFHVFGWKKDIKSPFIWDKSVL